MDDKTPYPQKARARIRAGKIITKLQQHVEGEIDMTPTQINAAKILLGKCVPDLKATENTNKSEIKHSLDEQSIEQALVNVRGWLDSIRA